MITAAEAKSIVFGQAKDFGIVEVPLKQSLGRILREEIAADRDMPPYDRVTMDGIAITYATYASGQRSFPIVGIAAAGSPQLHIEDPTTCVEIMTGAIMPTGVDTVVPYEKIEVVEGIATIIEDTIKPAVNIHRKGEDRKAGDVLLSPGIKVSSVDIGVCATVGKSMVKVSRLPRAVVISSGDELVEIDEQPQAHQIRKSNVFRLKAVLNQHNVKVDTLHILDDKREIIPALEKCIADYDLIVISGGVSKGKFDFLPEALEQVGVQKLFHRVLQRPGKPFWFGVHPQGSTVFAFPGNPVSSFMCMQNYLVSWLSQSLLANPQPVVKAKLTHDVIFEPDLTYYLEVKIDFSDQGEVLATPVRGHGSGDLANMVDADAFIELPQGKDLFKAGEVYPILRYRDIGI